MVHIVHSQGNDLFKEGRYELAVECYSKAAELDPLNAIMPANRAMALLKLQRWEVYSTLYELVQLVYQWWMQDFWKGGVKEM